MGQQEGLFSGIGFPIQNDLRRKPAQNGRDRARIEALEGEAWPGLGHFEDAGFANLVTSWPKQANCNWDELRQFLGLTWGGVLGGAVSGGSSRVKERRFIGSDLLLLWVSNGDGLVTSSESIAEIFHKLRLILTDLLIPNSGTDPNNTKTFESENWFMRESFLRFLSVDVRSICS